MRKIRFTSWNKDMNKIKFIHLLNERTNLSLKESKDVKDRIVNGEVVEVEVDDDKIDIVVSESVKFGLDVEEVFS